MPTEMLEVSGKRVDEHDVYEWTGECGEHVTLSLPSGISRGAEIMVMLVYAEAGLVFAAQVKAG